MLRCIDAGMVAYLTLMLVLPLALNTRIVTWWDDVNFWASDLKALYYLGGFARKYANVSPQFGDYPPAVQLAKWYVVHMDRHAFRENLAFAGYHLFNLSFLMPLFGRLRGKNALWGIPLAFAAWAFAGIAEIFGYAGFCADLSMAYLFGSVLIEAISAARIHERGFAERDAKLDPDDNRDAKSPDDSHDDGPDDDKAEVSHEEFHLAKVALYLSVLSLCKSTGYIWALLGGIIWLVAEILNRTRVTKKHMVRLLATLFVPLLSCGSWMAFCLVNHRVAQTTSTMVTYVTSDAYGLSAYSREFASAFIRAFFTQPLHVDRTWIDLPPAFMFVLIIAVLILFRTNGFIKGKSGTFLCVALPVSGLIYYVLIFIAHLTMFATETQYLEPEGMIASIERYGAPYVLGCLLLISHVWLKHDDAPARMRIFVICVLALTNLPAAFDGLIGYRKGVKDAGELRNAFIEDDSRSFLDVLEASGFGPREIPKGGVRICRVRDGAYYRVQDAYVAYEASPASVLAPSVQLKDADAAFFVKMVNDTHAEYLYVDEQPGSYDYLDEMVAEPETTADDDPDGNGSGDTLLNDGNANEAGAGAERPGFKYETVYGITYEDGQMKLREVKAATADEETPATQNDVTDLRNGIAVPDLNGKAGDGVIDGTGVYDETAAGAKVHDADAANHAGNAANHDADASASAGAATDVNEERDTVTLCMVGDVLLHTPVEEACRMDDGSYDFTGIFDGTRDAISEYDLALVNQEVIIGGEELGVSGYPAFNAPYAIGDALHDAGFDIVLHATNHVMDKGMKGIDNCLHYWESAHPDVEVLGIHDSPEDRDHISIITVNGIDVAFLNYTYGTNGIAIPNDRSFCVDLMSEDRVLSDLARAEAEADFTVVCPHWGTEYRLEPDASRDGTLVYYSPGNFVNWTSGTGEGTANRMVGGMATVEIGRDDDGIVRIKDYGVTALVTDLRKGQGGVVTYRLDDYAEDLARDNAIRLQDPSFSYEYCVDLCNQVWGNLWE